MDAAVVNKLKYKAIDDYLYFLNKLEKGYKIDHSNILNIINFLETYKDINNSNYISSVLINGK